jgi:hypothetical protein
LIQSIIDNMSLSNREELIAAMKQAQQPDPQAQQAQQAAMQADMRFKESQAAALEGQAAESEARAAKYAEETRIMPIEVALKNLPQDAEVADFQRRLELGRFLLEERKAAQTNNNNGAA